MSANHSSPAIVILSQSALAVAEKIKAVSGGDIHALKGRVETADVFFNDASQHLGALFLSKRSVIGVMASGALIRLLAPHIGHKHDDPAVLSVADDGSSVVPLLGGHHGSNQIARVLSEHLGGHAAITTAGDVRFSVALDEPPKGWRLADSQAAKPVMAALLAGATVRLEGALKENADWLLNSQLPFADDGEVVLSVGETQSAPQNITQALHLAYHPTNHVVGLGCERGADVSELIALVQKTLEENNINPHCIACFASIDVKADETALHQLAAHFDRPLRFFDAASLEQQSARLQNPSDVVFAEVGCHGVSEGAALAGVGDQGALVVAKQKSKRATVAIARRDQPVVAEELGRMRGHLSVVGIGPGSIGWRSPEVSELVSAASDLVGYSLYLDLLGGLSNGKTRHDFDLGKEEDRVRHAMELAGQGKNVALVCSGDAGIYAMATLVYELFAKGGLSDGAQRIAVQVSPGISALQAAAARAGAPLGHDFCTISLSDLLTPWPSIQTRLKAAAEGDFVIAFYNPVSKRRRTQLAYARDLLLQHRPADTPVILATNLGREGERIRVVPLAELNIDDVDMLTVVVVGSSDTKTVTTGDGNTWVYTPRGYAAKEGTRIGK